VIAAFDEEAADLVDDSGALPDKPRAHAVEREKIALLGRLDGNEVHGGPLHRLGDGLGIAVVVLEEGFTYCAGIRRTSCPSVWIWRAM